MIQMHAGNVRDKAMKIVYNWVWLGLKARLLGLLLSWSDRGTVAIPSCRRHQASHGKRRTLQLRANIRQPMMPRRPISPIVLFKRDTTAADEAGADNGFSANKDAG